MGMNNDEYTNSKVRNDQLKRKEMKNDLKNKFLDKVKNKNFKKEDNKTKDKKVNKENKNIESDRINKKIEDLKSKLEYSNKNIKKLKSKNNRLTNLLDMERKENNLRVRVLEDYERIIKTLKNDIKNKEKENDLITNQMKAIISQNKAFKERILSLETKLNASNNHPFYSHLYNLNQTIKNQRETILKLEKESEKSKKMLYLYKGLKTETLINLLIRRMNEKNITEFDLVRRLSNKFNMINEKITSDLIAGEKQNVKIGVLKNNKFNNNDTLYEIYNLRSELPDGTICKVKIENNKAYLLTVYGLD